MASETMAPRMHVEMQCLRREEAREVTKCVRSYATNRRTSYKATFYNASGHVNLIRNYYYYFYYYPTTTTTTNYYYYYY